MCVRSVVEGTMLLGCYFFMRAAFKIYHNLLLMKASVMSRSILFRFFLSSSFFSRSLKCREKLVASVKKVSRKREEQRHVSTRRRSAFCF